MNSDNCVHVISLFFLAVCVALFAACGVRGRPQPPLTPAEIGNGRPGISRALPKSELDLPKQLDQSNGVEDEDSGLQKKKRK